MPEKPGCVVPSIVIPVRNAIAGRSVASAIECGPEPAMLNAMMCGPAAPLASRIAWRSDPAPESAIVVTVYVVAESDAAKAKPRATPRQATRVGRIGDSFFVRRGDVAGGESMPKT